MADKFMVVTRTVKRAKRPRKGDKARAGHAAARKMQAPR